MRYQRFVYACLLASACAGLFSCKDDNEEPAPQDNEKPAITVSSPVASSFVYNTVSIAATASDDKAVTSVKIYLDNSTTPLKELTAGTVAFDWDTKNVADGNHTLKFVVRDEAGNETVQQISVTVRNVLVSFFVPANYIPNNTEYWIFIADEEGAVLDGKQLQNNQTYTLKAPANFDGQNIGVNILQYTDNATYSDFYSIMSFPTLPPGDYRYPNNTTPSSYTSLGTAHVILDDAPDLAYFNKINQARPRNVFFNQASFDQGLNYSFSVAAEQSAVLLTQFENSVLTYLYRTVVPGEEYHHYLGEFQQAEAQRIAVPKTGDVWLTLGGTNEFGEFAYFQREVALEDGGITAQIPSEIFTSHRTQLDLYTADAHYRHSYRGDAIPTTMTFMDANLSYTVNGNTLEATTTGTCDFVAFSSSASRDDLYISWNVYTPGATTKQIFKVPALHDAIKERFPTIPAYEDFDSGYAYVYDYDDVSGFDAYISSRLKSETLASWNEYRWISKNTPFAGGRLKQRDKKFEVFMPKGW